MAHETLLTIFIIIAAAAVVLQAFVMFGMYKAIRRIQDDVAGMRADVARRIEPLADSLKEIITNSRDPLRSITTDLAEVARVAREGAGKVDDVLDDLLDRFRLQVIRVDQTVTDVLEKVDKTTTAVQKNIIGPVTEVSAILKGLQVGLDFFLTRRRQARTSEVPQDEQMFI